MLAVAGRREEPVGVRAWAVEGESSGWSLRRSCCCAVPRPPAAPAHLSSGDMTGTPGAAATRDSETPQRSPPCSPSYDLTGKVGGHCAQRWGLLCRLWGPPLPPPPRTLRPETLEFPVPRTFLGCVCFRLSPSLRQQSGEGGSKHSPWAHPSFQGSGLAQLRLEEEGPNFLLPHAS